MKPASALIHLAVEPKFKADRARFAAALGELEAADGAFQARIDSASGQTILGGTSELHLQTKVEALLRDHRLDLNIGAPQVAYLETITQRAEIDHTLKQLGEQRSLARVKLSLAPRDQGLGSTFVSGIVLGALPESYVAAIGRSVDCMLASGVLAGFPVADVAVTLVDATYHGQDSSVAAFEAAARSAMREGLQKGRSILLEPIMALEMRVPTDSLDAVLIDLRQRRGIVRGQETSGTTLIVNATAPLAHLFNYLNVLRSLSEGRATYSMQFSHYAAVPSFNEDGPHPAAMALCMPAVLALGDSA